MTPHLTSFLLSFFLFLSGSSFSGGNAHIGNQKCELSCSTSFDDSSFPPSGGVLFVQFKHRAYSFFFFFHFSFLFLLPIRLDDGRCAVVEWRCLLSFVPHHEQRLR